MKTLTNGRGPIMTARAADVALRRHLDSRTTGRRLAWARAAASVSQDELAAYVGCSATTIRRVEQGERALHPAERAAIARALGTSIATLTAPAIALGPASNGNGKATR